ncbi:MAG: 23S rRNA (adenine(2503)-C(2))-methyltransferase RlmN [Roseiflexaceae bacterium]
MTPLTHLYNLSLPELEALLAAWKQPAFRARQIYRQSYVNLADDPQQMTDLPLALRERLASEVAWQTLTLTKVQIADAGMTRKALFRLPSGEAIESVLMVYADRATVCVSTQAGCAMGCVFCATGRLGLLRNLTAGQIIEQVLWAARELRTISASHAKAVPAAPRNDEWWAPEARNEPATGFNTANSHLTNIVFMGMGEPFANYDRWWQAVERLHDPQGFGMGARNMTVSTVGLPQGIRRLAEAALPVNLAISLHAPDDALRSALMPVNVRFPISDLMAATRLYATKTNRRVSFEYVLLQGQNDQPQHAASLANLLRGQGAIGSEESLPLHLAHVNLIPWNPVPGMPLGRSEWQRVLDFQRVLQERGVSCTVRMERGVAIAAACGQLAGDPTTIAIESITATSHSASAS